MKRTLIRTCLAALALAAGAGASARGVSPYLPVNLSPEMERQIEQVLILAGQPVLSRPIATATVNDALPKACERDEALCRSVKRYLERYMHTTGLTDASLAGMSSREEVLPVPNQHGMNSDSPWRASARAYWQPGEHVLLALGGTAYDGNAVPNGTVLSVGFEYLQLDAGWLDYSISPLMDSSMLLSTESQTMPQVSISNYTPMTRLGLRYRVLWARMAHSDEIAFEGGLTSGRPEMFGVSASIEPVSGWAFGVNRLMQYGGGERDSSFSDVLQAFFDPTRYDNEGNLDEQFGNQVASITSSFVYPGATPFAVHVEYAGEDTVRNRNHLLGNAALSVGIRWPSLWQRFDLALEASEWQNAWYVHPIYGDGLANEGHVIGHWGADQRVFNDDVGGHAATLRLGWRPQFGGLAQLRVRASEPEDYSPVEYTQGYEVALGYAREIEEGMTAGLELVAGRDVFGDDYSQVRGFARYSGLAAGPAVASADDEPARRSAELFLDAGVSASRVRIDESSEQPVEETSVAFEQHFALGARRIGTGRHDVGVRLELDEVEGHLLTSVRAVDYRYRFDSPLALGFFLGAARYDRETPAYGLYYGIGAHWRDALPGWDLTLDARYAEKVGRDHVLPEDPESERPVSYYDIYGLTLYVARRF